MTNKGQWDQMEHKDYYKVMGLEKSASQEDIKRTYRKLARKYHPDVSKEPDALSKFKELGQAYEVLKDPEKRKKYDQYGQFWQSGAQGQDNPSYQYNHQGDVNDFEDFISSIFKQQQQRDYHRNTRGQDIHSKINITLEDSFHGALKTLQLQIPEQDTYGQIHYRNREVKVKIPKGIADKQSIRLKGQGDKGLGHSPGDLYLEISIKPHPWFHLHQRDIHLDLPISPWEAALGATVTVPTLGGPVKLTIPKLSQSGKQMRLKGRGLPSNGSSEAGAQIVKLYIVIPHTDNPQMTHLFEQMAKTSDFNPRQSLGVTDDKS